MMSKLNWFSGGKERSNQALALITEILRELDTDQNSQALQKVLANYQNELRKEERPIPFILSQMNVEISNILNKKAISLSNTQVKKLKQLLTLSYIRYGY
ncbi:bacteriocin immunity protein [Enterococcus avium]|uniref:bacteriocin immunity protein n=1 Tax=Enterococcus avium TaxID=33945 RepID=UPI00289255D8|nr:bacteriocin immunity protein [Enterococcus avium]MDT2493464.1 bacteriocin immunity protein [Enterococcus avium]